MSVNIPDVANILPLSYGLSLLKELLPAPTHIFKSDNHYFEKFDNNQIDDWNVLKTDFEFRCELLKTIREKGIVVIPNEKPILYGGVKCTDDLTLIIGPISIAEVDQNFCKLYALKHKATNFTPYKCTVKKLVSFLLLVYSSITYDFKNMNEFIDDNLLTEDLVEETNRRIAEIFSRQSIDVAPHNPGLFEDSIKYAIKEGNVEDLKKALNSIYANMRGTLSRQPLRNAKDLAIVDITIASRAAIDAGLSVEEMYTISDAFIQEVEECKFEHEAQALARACALRCTQMVANYKTASRDEDSSLIVARACQYIEHHIYEKILLDDICAKLKVSASYLSKMFKDEKNITIGEYIRSRKIEIAKMLLTTTDKSISEISMLLSFNSQSHFGQLFLKITGITPANYRNKKAIPDLIL